MISGLVSNTFLTENEVYSVGLLGDPQVKSEHSVNALVLVRPSELNIHLLVEELSQRRCYASYHLFFTQSVGAGQIHALAEADEHELVEAIQVSSLGELFRKFR